MEKVSEMEKKVAEMEKSRRDTDRLDPLVLMCVVSLPYAVIAAWLLWRAADGPQALLWTFGHLLCVYLFLWIIALSETLSIGTVFFRVSYVQLLSVAAVYLIGPVNGTVVVYCGMIHTADMLGYAAGEYIERVGIELTTELNGVEFSRVFGLVCMGIGVVLLFTVAKAVGLLSIWFGLMGLGGLLGYVRARCRYPQIPSRRTDRGPLTGSSVVAANVERGSTTEKKEMETETDVVLGLGQCQAELEEVLPGQVRSSEEGSEMVRVAQPAGVDGEASSAEAEVEHMPPSDGSRSALDALVEAVVEPITPAILRRPIPRAHRRKKSSPTAAPCRRRRLVVLPSATLTAVTKAQRLIMEKLVITVEPPKAGQGSGRWPRLSE